MNIKLAIQTLGTFVIGAAILGLLVFCALDHRFGWSEVPPVVSLIGDGLVALWLFVNLVVFRENSFGGSSIETVEGQRVISTGPYALVRHPMYGRSEERRVRKEC